MKEKQLAQFSLSDGTTTFLVEVDEPEGRAIQRVALSAISHPVSQKPTTNVERTH